MDFSATHLTDREELRDWDTGNEELASNTPSYCQRRRDTAQGGLHIQDYKCSTFTTPASSRREQLAFQARTIVLSVLHSRHEDQSHRLASPSLAAVIVPPDLSQSLIQSVHSVTQQERRPLVPHSAAPFQRLRNPHQVPWSTCWRPFHHPNLLDELYDCHAGRCVRDGEFHSQVSPLPRFVGALDNMEGAVVLRKDVVRIAVGKCW